jgi:surface polysaccharide O-acyltransferase-like enzyme
VKDNSLRNTAFDVLRVLSALSIIVMHLTSGDVFTRELGSASWTWSTVLNSISHFGVPVFVMISGALFMRPDKELDIKRLWKHNILRLFIVWIVWCIVYGTYNFIGYDHTVKMFLWSCVNSSNHLWFLPMIIGIYMITPILVRWIQNADVKEVKLFILLFFVFQILCETVNAFSFFEIVTIALEYRNIQLVCSYVGYFVLGYYLVHIGLTKAVKRAVYILGIISFFLEIFFTFLFSIKRGYGITSFVDSYTVYTFFYSLAIFQLALDSFGKKELSGFSGKLLSNVSKDTLGLYVSHILVIVLLNFVPKFVAGWHFIIADLFYILAVFIVGIAGSAVVRRIPFIGRYIC